VNVTSREEGTQMMRVRRQIVDKGPFYPFHIRPHLIRSVITDWQGQSKSIP